MRLAEVLLPHCEVEYSVMLATSGSSGCNFRV